MNILIAKLGATGDVVRTTSLLRRLNAQITWLTAEKNAVLLRDLADNLCCVSWEERYLVPRFRYDLIVNLEDTLEVALYLKSLECAQMFGAYADSQDRLSYTDDSRVWFDLSLVSSYGREEADRLKLLNRRTYQDLIFAGLGFQFSGEAYLLPRASASGVRGDVAISAEAGPVWPMKNWEYYGELKCELEARGYRVNVLPLRSSLLEHLADVRSHRCLVSGDSLPMHFALGTGTPCVTLFSCTSPWEIHDYGIQKKIVSPLLAEFFYQRGYNRRATTAIKVDEVFGAVINQLEARIPSDLRPVSSDR
jgi:ADP-heptose:LPS heptosyltransferase